MKNSLCYILFSLPVAGLQAVAPPNLGSVLEYDYSTDMHTYGWDSEENYPYFFQYSPDLMQWDYLNVIEPGDGQHKEWHFQIDVEGHVPTERFFLRLAYPDAPMVGMDLINGDADGDKVGSQDELDQGTDPLGYRMDDLDLIPDDWEIFFGLDTTPGVDDSGLDADWDGLNNANEFLAGTRPDRPDSDGNSLTDLQDHLALTETKLDWSTGAGGDAAGSAVAARGNEVLVGSHLSTASASARAGRALTYAFDGSDWLESASLQAPSPEAGAKLGRSLSVDGNWLATGVYQKDSGVNDSGSVEVFQWTGSAWTHTQTITSPSPVARGYFGQSVLAAGDLLIVGAPATGTASGQVYVYRRSGSTYAWEATLSPLSGSTGDAFGFSLAWSGDQLLVGAPLATIDDQAYVGAVYAFSEDLTVWSEDQRIDNPRRAKYDMFGGALSLHHDVLAIGSMGSDEAGTNAGAVYLYEEGDLSGLWVGIQRLLPSERLPEARFGASLLSLNESFVIGAPGNLAANQSGLIHFFRQGPTPGLLRPASTLAPTDAAAGQLYGFSLAASVDYLVVGAPGDSSNAGAAYVYPRPELTATDDTDGDGLPDAWEMFYLGSLGQGANDHGDGDNLTNAVEYWLGSNPNASDTDGNGVSDDLEDADGDGIGNLAEVQNGTSPWMPDSDLDGVNDSIDISPEVPSNTLATGLVVFTPLSQ